MDYEYTTGSKELDELIGGLPPRTMLLIVGHPGSGKTTLAAQICYANTLRGKKCLYVTFYEDKEKLYCNMGKLGINLAEAEKKGLLTYIRLPVVTTEDVLSAISDAVARGGYNVVVVDSINPALELLERKEAQRAILLNFFYQLASFTNGLLVSVAEIPLGKESLDLGSVEFVADAILYLKHRISRGLLSRILEVRKVRGALLSVTEVPFEIINGKGFKVYVPPRPERVVKSREHELKVTLSEFTEKLMGPLYRGDVVYISYPPQARDPAVVIPLIDLAVTNNARVLFVSYKYSPSEVAGILVDMATRYLGMSAEEASGIVNTYFYLVSINPVSHAITRLHAETVELVEELKPDVVVFHGVEVFRAISDHQEYWTALINELTWFKNKGIVVVRYGSRVDPYWTRMNESLSDAVIRVYCEREGEQIVPVYYAWRRGKRSVVIKLTDDVLKRYSGELGKLAKKLITRVD